MQWEEKLKGKKKKEIEAWWLVAGLIWVDIVVLEAVMISREEGGDGAVMVNQIWSRMEMVAASCDTVFVHVNEGTMAVWDDGIGRVVVVCWRHD